MNNNIQVISNCGSITNNSSVTVSRDLTHDMLGRFIAYLDASPKTIETYTKALRQLFNYFSIHSINKPTREDILSYRDELKSLGYKPTTIQNYITAAKIFFSWTAQEGFYPNIAERLKGAKINKEHKKDYLTSNQVKEILSLINCNTLKGLRDYALASLMVTGGMRAIEVVRADVGDLRTLGNNTVLYIQGKGREEKAEYIKISSPVERALRSYLAKRGEHTNSEPLFTSTSNNSNGKRLSTRSISSLIKNLFRRAGYDSDRLTAHSLRHTAVTLSLLAGKDITEVQQFARHANIATTMIYNHSLDKAANSCGDAITASIF